MATNPSYLRSRAARRGPVRRLRIVGHLRPRPGHAGLRRARGPGHLRILADLPGESDRDGQVHGRCHPGDHDHPDHLRGFAGGPPRRSGQSARGRVEPRRNPLRYARAGIFGAVILGLGRAVGETMAVTMTIGNRNAISVSLFDQGQTIASWIANNFLNATDPLELSALIELGLVLMLMSLVINIFARLMLGRVLRRGEGSA